MALLPRRAQWTGPREPVPASSAAAAGQNPIETLPPRAPTNEASQFGGIESVMQEQKQRTQGLLGRPAGRPADADDARRAGTNDVLPPDAPPRAHTGRRERARSRSKGSREKNETQSEGRRVVEAAAGLA